MASFFNLGRFGKTNKPPILQQINAQQPLPSVPVAPSQNASSASSTTPQISLSPPPTAGTNTETKMSSEAVTSPSIAKRPPFYFREEHSGLIVKGNFMTLAAQPTHVEKGEWLAHQIVEQYRLLEGMLKIIQEIDGRSGMSICNPHSCPQMTAANTTIYTWLDNQKNPIRIPASQYITLVQKWILGKITDSRIFPTDTTFAIQAPTNHPSPASGTTTPTPGPIPAGPTNLNLTLSTLAGRDWVGKSGGFPENFEHDIKNLYRQMFRCYAHIYYAHWLEPFYHLGLHKELNTCFIHFVNVGKQFDLLVDKDIIPMQPLIDIWTIKGLLPPSQHITTTTT